jgi:Glucodextranase, domain B
MDTVLKFLGSLVVLFIMALPMTGCDSPPWESGMTLVVKVDTPREGSTVTTSPVTVSGRVLGTERASAKLSVKNVDVPIKDDKFSTSVNLTEGPNVIEVVGSASGGAKPSQKLNVTYAPGK